MCLCPQQSKRCVPSLSQRRRIIDGGWVCIHVAVPTCWEQSAPFDGCRWKLHGLGSPRWSMLTGVCRRYRRAHMRERTLCGDLGGYIWSSSVTLPASQNDEVKEANKQGADMVSASAMERHPADRNIKAGWDISAWLQRSNTCFCASWSSSQHHSSVWIKMCLQNAANAGRRMLWVTAKHNSRGMLGLCAAPVTSQTRTDHHKRINHTPWLWVWLARLG